MTERSLRTKANRLVKALKPEMALDNWKIVVEVSKLEDTELNENVGDFQSAAWTSGLWEYKTGKIEIIYDSMKDATNEELCRVLIHEMTHLLLNELREWNPDFDALSPDGKFFKQAVKHEESVISSLESIFCKYIQPRVLAAAKL